MGKALENTREDEDCEGALDLIGLGDAADVAVDGLNLPPHGAGGLALRPHASDGMQAQGHAQVLGCGPEGIVQGSAVGLVFRRGGPDHSSLESYVAAATQF